jgi:DNA-directed RNA polymerase specialized sigma24 family protein
MKPPAPHAVSPSPVRLEAQYLDLIDLYVRRRVHDSAQADRVVHEVFLKARANPAQVRARPLPWLISTARHECIQTWGASQHAR